MRSEKIRLRGTVQGVGFRPHVWHQAKLFGITGEVSNDGEGVIIFGHGSPQALTEFVDAIVDKAPPLAVIHNVERVEISPPATLPTEFIISASHSSQTLTSISADTATCAECLNEIFDPQNRRYGYPFTNCTHCGPRFSIIKAMPYDRHQTSMANFAMCASCQNEYDNPADRRFHAQPNACAECGPRLWLENNSGEIINAGINLAAIKEAARQLAAGNIIAIKGIGGFHLACDATNAEAVKELRTRKKRYRKSLALMAKDIESIREFAEINPEEKKLLASPAAPVVLLKKHLTCALPESIAPNLQHIGFMLPYSPLHALLMAEVQAPIVMTSGNTSEEPQCISNVDARQRLANIADYFLLHDRDIINRIDDSVAHCADGKTSLVRRARGYAPQPLLLPPGFEEANGILAMGADLKNTFCLLHNGQAIVSQYIGDLEELTTQQSYHYNIELLSGLYDFSAQKIIVDKHPNYHSSLIGKSIAAEKQIPYSELQHHHAHIAATMAEHQLPLSHEPVLGIALDGLGFGNDDTFWGGEFLLTRYFDCHRAAYFKPVAMLGGNVAMREPWRNTLAQLFACKDWSTLFETYGDTDIIQLLSGKPLKILESMSSRAINSPLTSSAGRLFDAVAAALGICTEQQFHEGEAAMALEAKALAASGIPATAYSFSILNNNDHNEIDFSPMWPALLADLQAQKNTDDIAYRFHLTLCEALTQMTLRLSEKHKIKTVVLSGGVFQNRLLLKLFVEKLSQQELTVLHSRVLPANDGNIALGQAVIGYSQLKSPPKE